MRKPLLFAALLVGVFATSAVKADANQPGITFGESQKWELIPVVDLSAFYDTNARDAHSSESGGGGYSIAPALQLNYKGKKNSLGLSFFYRMERGTDNDDALDSDTYGESMTFKSQLSPRWRIELYQSFLHSEDDRLNSWNAFGSGTAFYSTTKQESYNLHGSASYTMGDKWSVSFGAGYNNTRYLTIDRVDTDTITAQLQMSRRLSEKSNLLFRGSLARNNGDSSRNSTEYSFMAGFGSHLDEDLTYNAIVGVSSYKYDNSADSGMDWNPSYSLSLAWRFSNRVTFSAYANSEYSPSYSSSAEQSSSYLWNNSFGFGANYQMTSKLRFRADLAYRIEDCQYQGENRNDYTRGFYQGALSSYYTFNRYLAFFASVSASTDRVNYSNPETGDFSENHIRCNIGLQFKY